jgi:ABC transporter substrate-binding protein (ThiB subfamily)
MAMTPPRPGKSSPNRVLTVTPGWSEAYGLFTSGEAPMVLSYTTSPAYHMVAEDTDRYQAAEFSEGHYLQIEVAGLLANAPDKDLARDFLGFMMTPGFQNEIPTNNWMLPARHRSPWTCRKPSPPWSNQNGHSSFAGGSGRKSRRLDR